jgi:hypothetical protein
MLIKFDSEAGGFTMNGDIAVQLLQAMGHSGTIPSAILAEDIPAALTRLRAAIKSAPAATSQSADGNDRDTREEAVSLRQRAYPLIDLLERAASRGKEVMWRKL